MDRKLTPQQELTATKKRLRTYASRVDGSLARGRRVGSLVLQARRTGLLKYGVIAAALLGLLGAVKPRRARGHWKK